MPRKVAGDHHMGYKDKETIMKKALLMFVLAVSLIQVFGFQAVASAQTEQAPQNIKIERVYALTDPQKCKYPQAPCTAEVFSSQSLTRSLAKSYTCGIQYKNAYGTVVATISETVAVTWTTNGFTINSASRNTWVKYSTLSWKNLSGPSPSSGSYGYIYVVDVITRGTLQAIPSWDATVRLSLLGREADPRWSCKDY